MFESERKAARPSSDTVVDEHMHVVQSPRNQFTGHHAAGNQLAEGFDPSRPAPARYEPQYGVPRIDEPAPPFVARSTDGMRSLDDYTGRWLVMFAHPADFTPVCTSEFIAFEQARALFAEKNCALLGLSVDSVFAHFAWIESIRERFGVEVGFPIIEDVSMSVSAAYGMIHPGSSSTATVRSAFIIDPDGILRAVMHYPMAVGRSVNEIMRVLEALQATHDKPYATPEGWHVGDALVASPPLTLADASRRNQDKTAKAWYYSEVSGS